MIYKSNHPLSPDTIIKINDVFVDYTSISEFTIELTENEHDYATIVINGAPAASVTDFFNAAVYLVIDSGYGRRQEFYGYVVSAEPTSTTKHGLVNNSYIQELKLQCLGASLLMKQVSSRIWDFPTLDNIVSELSLKYKLSASYPKDSFKPTRLTQSNESDWSFLRRVVSTYGYSMSVHGTHLHIWDVFKATRRLPSYHLLLTPQTFSAEHPGMVLKFEAYMGHLSRSGDTSSVINATIDQQGNVIEFAANQGGLKDTRAVKYSLFDQPLKNSYQTFAESERAVEARQRYQTLFRAHAEITAGAGIVPGGIVSLIGYGGEFDGVWYVSSVLHRMTNNMYTTQLELHKNNKTSEESITGALNVFNLPPEPIFVNGKWVSSSEKLEQYV